MAKGRGLPLEPSSDELRDLGGAALDFVVDFVGRRPTAPAVNVDDAHDLVDTLLAPPPEEGRPFADLLSLIGDAADVAVDTAGPGYMAYIPGGGLPGAAIAELVTLAVNRYPTVAALAPALTAVEASVARWLCDIVGFPPEAQGILTSGGSMATFSAIVAARHARLGDDAYDLATRVPRTDCAVGSGALGLRPEIFGVRPDDERVLAGAAGFSQSAPAPRQCHGTNRDGRSPSHERRERALDEQCARGDDHRTGGRAPSRAVRAGNGCRPAARPVARRPRRRRRRGSSSSSGRR